MVRHFVREVGKSYPALPGSHPPSAKVDLTQILSPASESLEFLDLSRRAPLVALVLGVLGCESTVCKISEFRPYIGY
jgi:hypothetical protein